MGTEADSVTVAITGDIQSKKFSTITLEEPLQRGETAIDKLTLRKPMAGELRGLSLQDLLTSEVSTILQLIPRISDPILNDDEARRIDPADFAQIAGTIRGFFLTKAEQATLDRMMSGQT